MRVEFPEGTLARAWIESHYRVRQLVRLIARDLLRWSYRRSMDVDG